MLIVVFDGLPTWAPDVSETGESSFASIALRIPTAYTSNFARDYRTCIKKWLLLLRLDLAI